MPSKFGCEVESMNLLRRFVRDEEGADVTEYGLTVALVTLAVAGAASLVGANLSNFFNKAACTVQSVIQS